MQNLYPPRAAELRRFDRGEILEINHTPLNEDQLKRELEELEIHREKIPPSVFSATKEFMRNALGEERFLKIEKAGRVEDLLQILNSKENRILFQRLFRFMPDDIFQQLLEKKLKKPDSIFDHDIISYFIDLKIATKPLEDQSLKMAHIVEKAYGGHTNVRFAGFAGLYALNFYKQLRGEIDEASVKELQDRLSKHYLRYKRRMEKLDQARIKGQEVLRYGIELETVGANFVEDKSVSERLSDLELKQAILGREMWELDNRLRVEDDLGHTEQVKILRQIINKKDKEYSDKEQLRRLISSDFLRLYQKGYNAMEKRLVREVKPINSWDGPSEFRSPPTADINLLIYELILLSRLKYINFDKLILKRSSEGNFFSIHLNTGGIKAKRNGKFDPDVMLLMHAEEATAWMNAQVADQSAVIETTSMKAKNEIKDREQSGDDVEKFQKHGNSVGIEERVFMPYGEKQMIELLLHHAQKSEALQGMQSLPDDVALEIWAISDPYMLYPPEPKYPKGGTSESIREYNLNYSRFERGKREFYGLRYDDQTGEKFKRKLDQIAIQTKSILSKLHIAAKQKELIKLWVLYRFQATFIMRLVNVPDPAKQWPNGSTERAKLYEAMALRGNEDLTYEKFKKPASQFPPFSTFYSPKFGGKTYQNIMQAMRELDFDIGNKVDKLIES